MKKQNIIKIGKNLQQIRKSHGYTQEKLAEKIDCSSRYISDVEQNKSKPSYEFLVKFCNIFCIGLDEIFIEYLTINKNQKIEYSLAGFDKLSDGNKKTIEHLIAYFNRN